MSLYVLLTIQLESPQGVISPTSPSKKKKKKLYCEANHYFEGVNKNKWGCTKLQCDHQGWTH